MTAISDYNGFERYDLEVRCLAISHNE